MSKAPEQNGVLAQNRKARHSYQILETLEAGIVLAGTEVKSIRNRELSIEEAFAAENKGELFLHNLHVRAYSHGNIHNHEPVRIRKLLLHKQEIRKIGARISQQGLTLVPLDVHLRRGKIKVLLGLAKGKNVSDKRESLKKKDADMDARRAMRDANR
ncbi:SsrA-binding protein SmpB [Kiritimatiellota bacterium B12222]|nr:SsrA-binding protein SmpB [Kiritimatiellota bacterium B12222]